MGNLKLHKVERVLQSLNFTNKAFAKLSHCSISVVDRACRGMVIHPRPMARMMRASGGLIAFEDFGPLDPVLAVISRALRASQAASSL